MLQRDLLTGENFTPTRINQRFAKPINRIKYHNNKANELRHKIDYINKPLHQSMRILNQLMGNKNESVFNKQWLLGRGFSFAVHTHQDKYNDKYYFALYEYLIIPLENDKVKIIKM